jgi:hypothetical protein
MNARISIDPGQIITTREGRSFRVKAKTASPSGEKYQLTNIAGTQKLTLSSSELAKKGLITSPKMMRFVATLRMIAVYGLEIDKIVKEAIHESGFPVDETQNWDKWFQKNYISRLLGANSAGGDDEDLVDEAISHVLVQELYDRKALSKFDASRVPADVQSKPLDKQITFFLTYIFGNRLGDAKDFISKHVGWKKNKDEDAPSQSQTQLFQETEEDGTEFNILDTEEHAQPNRSVSDIEEEDELKTIRDEFYEFVKETKKSEKIAKVMALIFDYIVESEHGKKSEFLDKFKNDTGLGGDRLKQLYKEFGKLMMEFSEYDPSHSILNLIRDRVGGVEKTPSKKSSLLLSSLKTADYYHTTPGSSTAPAAPGQEEEIPVVNPNGAPQNTPPPGSEGAPPTPGQPQERKERVTVPPDLPNQILHTSLNASKQEKPIMAATSTTTRQELLKKIANRKKARTATAAPKQHKLVLLAKNEPMEVKSALTELANVFGSIRASFLNMRDNLNLSDPPKTASPTEKKAAASKFAAGLKKLAEEEPEQFGAALSEVYGLLDEAAGAIENLAENSGVEIHTEEEPVIEEEEHIEEEPALPPPPVEEEPVEDEVKEASGSDNYWMGNDDPSKKFGSKLTRARPVRK